MPLTFPRAMPLVGVGGQRFELQRFDFIKPERSGRVSSMTGGFPLWAAEWTLAQSISQAVSDEWRAFVASLEGSSRLFLGREWGREYPNAYPQGFGGLSRAGGGSFNGSASWSQAIAADGQATLTLTTLPSGLVIAPGDYVDFRWTSETGAVRRAMVRSLQSVTANGSGQASFVVAPAVPKVTPSDAVAHLDNPACLMRLTSDTEVAAMDRRRVAGGRIAALQDLRP